MSLLSIAAALAACGHFGLDLLPATEDGVDAGDGPDADEDASLSGDGESDAAVDARVDAGCVGPKCPGTYVSGNAGDDANPGTGDKPVRTIARAIAIAKGLGGPQAVKISSAKYDEKVIVVENVSLLGGFECQSLPCGWTRDIDKNTTTIVDQDFEGVLAGNTITRATVLEGLTVLGKGGAPTASPGSAAMTIAGGSPTVKQCRLLGAQINGGATQAKRSIGIAILAPTIDPQGALIEGNAIRGGQSVDDTVGIYMARTPSAPTAAAAAVTIKKNDIRTDSGLSTAGIIMFSAAAATLVEENTINAGPSTTNGPSLSGAWGIAVAGSGTITRNGINVDGTTTCPTSPSFCGGIQSFSSSAVITSNIIRGAKAFRTAAVLLAEAEGPAGLVVLNGNTLDAFGDNGDDGTLSAAIVLRNNVGTSSVVGKVRNNILLGGTNGARYGVYEESVNGKQAHLQFLDNNDFWNPLPAGGKGFAYHYWDGSNAKDILVSDLPTKLTNPVPNANLGVDPALNNNFHLTAASTLFDKGTLLDAPAHDIDNDPRPKVAGGFIDIGADEAK